MAVKVQGDLDLQGGTIINASGGVGSAGSTGPTGPRGFTGASGTNGSTGATGATGHTGAVGPGQSYVVTIGDGTTTVFNITHNLGTEDVIVTTRDLVENELIDAEVKVLTTNSIRVTATPAPAASSVRVVVAAPTASGIATVSGATGATGAAGPTGPAGGATEVFRSNLYIPNDIADFGGDITDGILTIPPFVGNPAGTRVMIDNAAQGSDRGIWIAQEDTGTPGFSDGTFLYAPEEEQPYVDGNEGLIGSFGFDAITGKFSQGVLNNATGWEVVLVDFYVPGDATDWNDVPGSFTQALDTLANTSGPDAITAAILDALADYTPTADLGGAALLDVGTGAGTVAAGDAAPNTHAASHADGGADEISIDGSQVTTGTISSSRLPAFTPVNLIISGRYIRTCDSATTATVTANRLYYLPLWVDTTTTFDRIAINHAATTAGASSVSKLGIYNSSGNLPSTLLLDCGSVDLTTAAAFKPLTISQQLTRGLWWLGAVAQITSGSPTFTVGSPFIKVPDTGSTSNGTLFENSVSGSLPSTATPSSATTTQPPIIWLRAA